MPELQNENYPMQVFADHESSLKPIVVPRDYLWNLHRRIVYFGTSIPTIFKGKLSAKLTIYLSHPSFTRKEILLRKTNPGY